jgi:DNA-binding IclR family transcriptional regulator
LQLSSTLQGMTWGFLTSHARALLCIAADPGVRLREIAGALDVTERAAFGVIKDLVDAGYVVKERDGRRNRYHIRTEAALPETLLRQRTVGHLLALLDDTTVPARAKTPRRRVGHAR